MQTNSERSSQMSEEGYSSRDRLSAIRKDATSLTLENNNLQSDLPGSHRFQFLDENGHFRGSISYTYQHIVPLNGQWTELSCHVCSANTNGKGRYMAGVLGLHEHVVASHGGSTQGQEESPEEVLAKCNKRALSDQEVRRIEAGELSVGLVYKRGVRFPGRF
jgi:hypothetical protein